MSRLQKILLSSGVTVLLITGGGIGLAFKLNTKPVFEKPVSTQQKSNPIGEVQVTNKPTQQPVLGNSTNSNTSINRETQPAQVSTPTPSSTTTNYTPPPAAPTCPDYLKSSYTEVYNANINAENIKYASNKQSISEYWGSRGLLYSSMHQDALAAEDQRHISALSSIETAYQQQLTSHNCS